MATYSCFICSSANLPSSGPMFLRNMARESELMMAVLMVLALLAVLVTVRMEDLFDKVSRISRWNRMRSIVKMFERQARQLECLRSDCARRTSTGHLGIVTSRMMSF